MVISATSAAVQAGDVDRIVAHAEPADRQQVFAVATGCAAVTRGDEHDHALGVAELRRDRFRGGARRNGVDSDARLGVEHVQADVLIERRAIVRVKSHRSRRRETRDPMRHVRTPASRVPEWKPTSVPRLIRTARRYRASRPPARRGMVSAACHVRRRGAVSAISTNFTFPRRRP